MTAIRLRIATTNVPESMKRGLLKDRERRARRVVRFYRERRVDIGAVQEAGTYLEAAETPRLKALWAKFNDIVKGRLVGSGIVVNRWRFGSRLLDDITVGNGDDAVHIPVALVTHRRTKWQTKVYGPHRPTRRAVNAYLRPVIDTRLHEETKRDDAADMPWLIVTDANKNPWGWGVNLGQHGVDHVRGSDDFESLGQEVYSRPLLSDHEFLIADAVVEV
jgi:hypothetical protein